MQTPSAARPAGWRRVAAGAWHVPAGFFFLLRSPPLWPLAALPAALAIALSTLGLGASWYYVPRVLIAFGPARETVCDFVSLAAAIILGLGALVTGAMLGLGLALLLTAPLLDLLSQRVHHAAFTALSIDQRRAMVSKATRSARGDLGDHILLLGVGVEKKGVGLGRPLVGRSRVDRRIAVSDHALS